MKKHTAKEWILLITAVLTLLFFAVSFWIDDYRDIDIRTKDVKRIEKTLHELQNDASAFITEHLPHAIDNRTFDHCWTKQLSDKHVSLYIFKNDSILYWSDNLPVDIELLKQIDTVESYHNIGNGWYVTQATKQEGYKAIIFILIRTEYLYQNNFLKNNYNPVFHFANNMMIARAGSDEGELVSGVNGNPLFVISSDVIPGQFKLSTLYRWLAVLMTLLLCILVFYDWSKWKKGIQPLFYSFIILVTIRLLIFFNQLYFNTGIELFTPTIYAASGFLRSLGDLLLHSIFLYSFALILYHNRSIIKAYTDKLSKYKLHIVRIISIITVAAVAWGVNYISGSLVLNSNISFEAYRISSLSVYSLIAFIIIIISLAILLLAIQLQAFLFSGKGKKLLFTGQIIAFIALAFVFNNKLGIVELLFCIVFIVANGLAIYRVNKLKIPFRYFSVTVILFSFYTTALLFSRMSEREQQKREVWAHSLSAERDPAAEMLLRENEESIYKNIYLKQVIESKSKNEHLLFERLQDQHFKGYFQNYEKQFTICYPQQSLRLAGEGRRVNCYKYFKTERDLHGVPIPGSSHFWFMNNGSGRICYYGEFEFIDSNTGESAYLFINLFSKPETESIGYPELLLEGEMKKNSGMSNIYSYAKYKEGALITQSGSYDYSLNLSLQISRNHGNSYFIIINDYSHYIYKTGNDNVVIISRPKTRFIDIASLFSYNIVILFLGLFLLLALAGFPLGSDLTKLSYKRKITYVLLASITISLTVLTSTVLVFIVRQSEEKNAASIQDKLRSVMIELEQNFVEIHESPKENRFLTNVLINLSNAFYTDINIYSTKGKLLATSRDEIFEKKLLGNLMNREAYKVMTLDVASKYIHWEQIGNMRYYSAYAPYYDFNRNLTAYVNMPYFFKQSEFREEIMQLIANIINLYILLILLGTAFALFISNQLLRPLSEVQQKMGLLDLTKQPEKIDYRGNDEIGDLVREYNRMIGELAVNAQKLAASERDSAWREMARQIAHEIKNPLTPMQLSIQHVLRMKANNTPGWEDKLDAVAKSLLEQISILSNIASEFSSFARINDRELVPVDLSAALHKSINLFSAYDNVTFEIHEDKEGEKIIMADNEQLQRVFTNLIKNAIQAIENKPDGIVSLSIYGNDKQYIIKIDDNGSGIPLQLQNRLFQPNFTTKTSGTGLGLAISKNIVERFGGTIYYQDSELGGACFVIQFPVNNIGLELLQELK